MSYTIRTLLTGIPVTSNRGALGWSSVILIKDSEHTLLFDTGSYGDRSLLLQALESQGLSTDDIDAVAVSHFHFDHMVNLELFQKQKVFLHHLEFDYIDRRDFHEAQDPYVPQAHIASALERMTQVEDLEFLSPGIQVVHLPGHTPGTMGLYLQAADILLASDAVKNAADFLQQRPPACFYSSNQALESYARIRSFTNHIIPGHDREFLLRPDGRIDYLEQSTVHFEIHDNPNQPGRCLTVF